MATYPRYRTRQTFTRQRRRFSLFSADFFGLLFVVATFLGATNYLAQRIGFNLSFVNTAAELVGYTDPNAPLSQSVGFQNGAAVVATPAPPPPLPGAVDAPVQAQATAPAATGAYCPAGQQPAFTNGFADLQGQLGAQMGNPLGCEHGINTSGDTQQQTSTGLAYFVKASNLVAFTDGWNHWALAPHGLITWTGDSATPTADAKPYNPSPTPAAQATPQPPIPN